ncbi:hypothetical protein KIL84_018351 [Mauremys mutica]|uniref:Uncharacterized protein n=1 Tax=Mauremys mutica TaxID=74926 RepID=A0A9D3XT56_9SAUR|nr:hypothetical protein KIL84_018351 [Mauremys mutica]
MVCRLVASKCRRQGAGRVSAGLPQKQLQKGQRPKVQPALRLTQPVILQPTPQAPKRQKRPVSCQGGPEIQDRWGEAYEPRQRGKFAFPARSAGSGITPSAWGVMTWLQSATEGLLGPLSGLSAGVTAGCARRCGVNGSKA